MDWPRACERAAERLARRLAQRGQLSPAEVAATVAAALPHAEGSWLRRRLGELGWLRPAARIPFDLLDSPQCPAEFRGARREVVRLALFGLGGQGRPDFKHREATYQAICAQIVREARDLTGLSSAATRALSHPDVCRDPVLAAMVRSYVSEQEAGLRKEHEAAHPAERADQSQLRRPFEGVGGLEFPTRRQLLTAFLSLQREFEVHLAEYNEAAARYALDKMQELTRRFPVHVDREAVARHQQAFGEFLERCATFRRQIEDVAARATEAARTGDTKAATWLIRRLRAIHALTPVLLSADRFEALRQEIEQSGQRHEHREALSGLIAREREVADCIKKAGAAVYRFQRVAQRMGPEAEEYQRAEAAYRSAVGEVRALDTEWLAGLLLELETYLEDLNDPEGRAQAQLDRFVGTVRTALTNLRREIRAIQEERGAGTGPKSDAG